MPRRLDSRHSLLARDGRYCGPGWGYVSSDVPKEIPELPTPLDRIDTACSKHDQCFSDRGYFDIACDLALARELTSVMLDRNSSFAQRIDADIMAAYFIGQSFTVDLAAAWMRTTGRLLYPPEHDTAENNAQTGRAVPRLDVP